MMPADRSVAMALTYYHPYVSGLTEAARLVAEGLAARDWRVTVVASRHDRELPPRERVAGVDVVRTTVAARLGKGVISPGFVSAAVREGHRAGLLNLHTPLLEAGPIARFAAPAPVVTTYQCDVTLPDGWLNRGQVGAMDASSRMAFRHSAAVVPSSADYLNFSRVRRAARPETVHVISPPCVPRPQGRPAFRRTSGLHVGFLGRLVEEKGVEYLVDAFRQLPDPDARLLIAGDYAKVAGGSVVASVRKKMGRDTRIELLGFLPDSQLSEFYASLDVFVLPSVNALEAFGIVQVEAMMAGVPVIASGLPGVREPVRETGFGRVVEPRDVAGLADAMRAMQAQPPNAAEGARRALEVFGVERTVDAYEDLFAGLRRATEL